MSPALPTAPIPLVQSLQVVQLPMLMLHHAAIDCTLAMVNVYVTIAKSIMHAHQLTILLCEGDSTLYQSHSCNLLESLSFHG